MREIERSERERRERGERGSREEIEGGREMIEIERRDSQVLNYFSFLLLTWDFHVTKV